LLVYDIDNTLLTANQDLGSDQWFNWQAAEVQAHAGDAVANDINGLIDIQTALFSLGKMHPVDAAAPGVFDDLQREGFTTVLLTSRGTNNRDATARELERNGFQTLIAPLAGHGVAGSFAPYDIQHPDDAGLTQSEVQAMGLGPAKPVTLVDGLYMTSGQHKGAMLRTLLYKLHKRFSAILFIDDTPKHVVRMHDAFDAKGTDVVTIRYSKTDDDVKKFEQLDKSSVSSAWQMLKQTLGAVFQ
jgi:hypothetical protein